MVGVILSYQPTLGFQIDAYLTSIYFQGTPPQACGLHIMNVNVGIQNPHDEGNSDASINYKNNKKIKSTKVKEKDRSLVLGEGIRFDEVMDTVSTLGNSPSCNSEMLSNL